MKLFKIFSLLLVLVLTATVVAPVQAQLGGVQKSSFTIQNPGDTAATVKVKFYDQNGTEFIPTPLVKGGTSGCPANDIPNPFSLDPGKSIEIYVPCVPTITSGSYSVVIESNMPVVATANLLGDGGTSGVNYNGAYSGSSTDDAALDVQLPSFIFHRYGNATTAGWYSAITVQNTGSATTDITVNISCDNNSALTGTLKATGVKGFSSVTFDTKTTAGIPTGFTASSTCNGSAVVHSSASPVIAIDNQVLKDKGNTQTFNSVATGANTLYVPALYVGYYGWDASLNIRKTQAGAAAVVVTFSDRTATAKCNLTDAAPSCLLYMPAADVHPANGAKNLKFGATITSTGSPVVAVVNASTSTGQGQTYNAVKVGSATVFAPGVLKKYYGWNSSVTCQNVSDTATTLTVAFAGFPSFKTASLKKIETVELYTPALKTPGATTDLLPDKFTGGVTITADVSGAQIACVINHSNEINRGKNIPGDWSMSTNAFTK